MSPSFGHSCIGKALSRSASSASGAISRLLNCAVVSRNWSMSRTDAAESAFLTEEQRTKVYWANFYAEHGYAAGSSFFELVQERDDTPQRLIVRGENDDELEALTRWAWESSIVPRFLEVMAIGDNWNDREMLEYAGFPVVMGNSVPELQSLGWTVTLSNDENGVAEAIRTYALNETAKIT